MLRTHNLGQLNKDLAGKEVILSAWVQYRRDHGSLIFLNLRDHYGLVQVKIDKEAYPEVFKEAEKLKHEWVIQVKGKVCLRPDSMVNKEMKLGEIEIEASELKILNSCETLPFEISEIKAGEANESLRLKYRFLDLRRDKLQELLKVKAKFLNHFRDYFTKLGFLEIQTPILANSSPEGARDFLVPSRLHPGKCYALPQAPQQFKQLLMVGGIDKYFQIAPCFRDEDPRQDRAYGEFYQLDMEMSFVEIDDIFKVMEPVMISATEKFSNKKLIGLNSDGSFKRLAWREALDNYGSDKPDLRYELKLVDVSEACTNSGFKVFDENLKNGGVVKAIVASDASKFTRKIIDTLTEVAKKKGAKGLAYLAIEKDNTSSSPVAKFLSKDKIKEISQVTGAKAGDIIFFASDSWRTACESLGAVRSELAKIFSLADNNLATWAWIVDFPMYDYSENEPGKIDFSHNPFSMPQGGLDDLENKDPLDVLAYQFDLVLNGFEISSGSIRNHRPEVMYKAFAIAGYSKAEVDEKFGAMIKAFSFGAPPHGGNAPGVDRLLMVLQDLNSIRDIYAFPKDGQGQDLMAQSPSSPTDKELKDLHIRLCT
ncbi:MAG: aspartate--tRNA ligase [Candidatus Pacebacteria bacterium]|nr:aspartate--tRNA ligase [Candidatus Paceibacterota bacterium]